MRPAAHAHTKNLPMTMSAFSVFRFGHLRTLHFNPAPFSEEELLLPDAWKLANLSCWMSY